MNSICSKKRCVAGLRNLNGFEQHKRISKACSSYQNRSRTGSGFIWIWHLTLQICAICLACCLEIPSINGLYADWQLSIFWTISVCRFGIFWWRDSQTEPRLIVAGGLHKEHGCSLHRKWKEKLLRGQKMASILLWTCGLYFWTLIYLDVFAVATVSSLFACRRAKKAKRDWTETLMLQFFSRLVQMMVAEVNRKHSSKLSTNHTFKSLHSSINLACHSQTSHRPKSSKLLNKKTKTVGHILGLFEESD